MVRPTLRAAVWLASLSAIVAFLMLAAIRLFYPLELDYIEGVMMDHVVRLAQGRPIYVEPTLEFITLAYMPGYATVSSLLARVFGPALWEPRLVSLLAMCVNASLVARILWLETHERTLAVAGAGILIAAFGVTGAHYDVGRPDSLMLCLALSGLTVLRYTRRLRGAMLAALLLTCAFFTKQHAVWFVIAALFHLALSDRMRFWVFLAVALVGCVGGYFLLRAWLGPWFSFFTWEVPTHWSSLDKVRILNYVGRGLFGTLGILTMAGLLSLALPDRPWEGPRGVWWWAALGAVCTGFMATLDPDAFRHVINPTVLMFSVLGPLALWMVVGHVSAWPDGSEVSRPVRSSVLYVLLIAQFLPMAYSLHDQRPHPRAAEAHAVLMERIRSWPGPVLMLYHGFYTWQAGKGTSLHQITLDDVVRARGNWLLEKDPGFMDRLFAPLRDGSYRPMIITDIALERSGSESNPWWRQVAAGYQVADTLGWESAALNPVDGNHWTPRYVYVPVERSGPDVTKDRATAPAAPSSVAAPAPTP
jgi:hypothetical protein